MKKQIRISLMLLLYGWVPFVVLAPLSRVVSKEWGIAIFLLGFILASVGSLGFAAFTSSCKEFWFSLDTIEELKKQHIEKIKELDDHIEAIKRISAADRGFTKARIQETIDKINNSKV